MERVEENQRSESSWLGEGLPEGGGGVPVFKHLLHVGPVGGFPL